MAGIWTSRLRARALICAGSFAIVSAAAAQDAPIVLPGAPGAAPRALSAEEAVKIADTRYSPDDVRFMQDMIVHHAQAVEMSALVKDRTNRKEIVEVAGRISASQDDEMKFMRDWLVARGEPEKAAASGHDHTSHSGHGMIGMATPDQMKALAAVKGADFDREFLTLMTKHHDGALKMVDKLFEQPGAAYDPVLFEFVNDVKSDQTAEIKKMNALLAGLSPDPRVGLKPGFKDAGAAASGMTLIASLPQPAGFFDPANPAGLPLLRPEKDDGKKRRKPAKKNRASVEEEEDDKTKWSERSPLLDFSNTDIAFSGDTLIAGSYHGFNIYKLPKDSAPALLSSVVCPGGQGDVSIVGDLLIMSVEQTRGRVDCGLQGVSGDVSPERFRGIRIFDISDLKAPRQVGQVQTCRGSHTHSVVSGPGRDGKIIVYNSGTARVRDKDELSGCVGDIPGDERTALFRIDVIEIPVADPSKARIIDSPAVFADPASGRLAGLWQGGDHGDENGVETQKTSRTDQCHDITVFPAKKIAAGACSGNGVIFDITNPRKPRRIDDVSDKGFAYWHSATFNNDGTKVLFTDEWGGGGRPRCRASDPVNWGANAIYDIVDGKLVQRSLYKLPAPQTDEENCVAHNGSVVPVPGRDIFVQAWYQGGISVIDFTDSAKPVEIAFFDRGPIDKKHLIVGGYWSAYWYDGRIYGTEIARGLDAFELSPSDHLTANEIAAAKLADLGETVNAQQQFPASWPADPVIARAYIDQLTRSGALTSAADMMKALDDAAARLGANAKDAALAKQLQDLAAPIGALYGDAATKKRGAALAETLKGIAARLR
ncbi:MAG: DUF305 domain-containing protein [Parvularculaceae bacterium]